MKAPHGVHHNGKVKRHVRDKRVSEYVLTEQDMELRRQVALEVLHEMIAEWADKIPDTGKSTSQLLRELANQLEGK